MASSRTWPCLFSLLLFGTPLLGCHKPNSTSASSIPLIRFGLHDVQGLWGGRNLWVLDGGSAILQVVTRPPPGKHGLWEKRYEFKVEQVQWARFESLLHRHGFLNLKIKERPGIPDEARPEIWVVPKSSPAVRVAKWANDKNPHFDPLYEFLRGICLRGEGEKPSFEGAYDANWAPPGLSSKP